MNHPPLESIARITPIHTPKNLVALIPSQQGATNGLTLLEHAPELVLKFIQANRWTYPLCMVAEESCQLLQPGTIVLATNGAAIMSYMLRWYALKPQAIWVDTFHLMPPILAAARIGAIRQLEGIELKHDAQLLANDRTVIQTARRALRSGFWELKNLPCLGGVTWPTGQQFYLTDPALSKDVVEESYREGLYEMIDRELPLQGRGGAVPAHVLFGVRVTAPETLLADIRRCDCARERLAPCAAIAL